MEPVASTSTAMSADPRVHFDRTTNKWAFEQEDGQEFEYNPLTSVWQPVLTEEILAAQQAAYSVQGVDEAVPAAPVLAREAQQKRKLNPDEPKPTKKSKRPPKSTAPRQTAVYITSLPPSTTVQQLATAFLKAGLILEDAAGEPKVKLYYDQAGKFKGEALVVYLKEESVELAVRLLDDTELVVGSGEGEMKVVKATWENKAKPLDEEGREMKVEKGKKIDIVKQKNGRRAEKLKAKLADWSSDDEDAASLAAKAKYSRLVVLKGMFTLQELEEDATLLLDLKEDVREECESLGEVTNVTLYDKEEDGIMTIRFKDELSAQACIIKNNNRFFSGRSISAFLYDGSIKYRKSGQGGPTLEGTGLGGDVAGQVEEKEKERLEKYAEWLERDGKELPAVREGTE